MAPDKEVQPNGGEPSHETHADHCAQASKNTADMREAKEGDG